MRLLLLVWVGIVTAAPYLGDSTVEDGGSFREDVTSKLDDEEPSGFGVLGAATSSFKGDAAAITFGMNANPEDVRFSPQEKMINFNMGSSVIGGVKEPAGDIIDKVANSIQAPVNQAISSITQAVGKLPIGTSLTSNPEGILPGVGADVDIASQGNSIPELRTIAEPLPRASTPQMPVDMGPSHSYTEILGFPSPEKIFESLDQKVDAAQKYWDRLMSQNDIQEDVKLGVTNIDKALTDAKTTSKSIASARDLAEANISSDKAVVEETKNALGMSEKLATEDSAMKELALEAKEWVDKVLKKAIVSATQSQSAKTEIEDTQKLADEALKRDLALREQIKQMYNQSQQAVKEAADAQALLLQLQKDDAATKASAEEAVKTLRQIKEEETLLQRSETKLRKELAAEKTLNVQSNEQLASVRADLQAKLDNTTKALAEANEHSASLEDELEEVRAELAQTRNETALKLQQADEELKEQNANLTHIIEEATHAAEIAEAHEKSTQEEVKHLEQERDAANQRLTEKLQLAKQRTKEWVHTQIAALVDEEKKKDEEIAELKKKITELQEQAKKPAVPAAVLTESVALQVEEGSGKKQAPQLSKSDLLPKLKAAKARVEHLLGLQGVLKPEILPLDLEMTLDPDFKLKRRIRKALEAESTLPSGYPPPPGTAKLQDVVGLELEEGASGSGYGDPKIAQGVNGEIQPRYPKETEDHCIRICSGGEPTVYRDGQVSTASDENKSLVHETGACMRLCATFMIEDCKTDPAKC